MVYIYLSKLAEVNFTVQIVHVLKPGMGRTHSISILSFQNLSRHSSLGVFDEACALYI